MDLLISASLIASFFAGVAALFAPCCITVLLPTYFASIFKQRTTVFIMTFFYFLGLLAVFLPLGLGATFISQFIGTYHNTIFLSGGLFLIFLGLMLVSGRHLALPFYVRPELKGSGVGSVFILGLFSAIATTCCAPVLAGVLTLSVLPGSVILGGIYTLTYVLGMVVPLFIIASFLDKVDFTQKFFVFRKSLNFTFLTQKFRLTFANLLSGLMFLTLGIIILISARRNELMSHSSYQLTVNIYLTKFIKSISAVTRVLPEPVWAVIFTIVFLLIIKSALNQIMILRKTSKRGGD